jgi:glycosyltransferase involved in cell wall biosynthesis
VKDATHTPLVSCIVPVFNGERYLAEALDSAFAQAYRPLEIVVVDDGSTDGTARVIAAYGERVCAMRQDNAGPSAARNRGVRASHGEFIAFLDADDRWHPEKLTRQMARFAARPELDLCVTWARNFWIAELHEEEARFREHRIAAPLPGYLAPTLLARRRAFERVGEFDPSLYFSHSTEWFLRAAELGCIVELMPDVLYERRLHHANRSRQLNAASRDEFLELVKQHLDRRRAARPANSPAAMSANKHRDR